MTTEAPAKSESPALDEEQKLRVHLAQFVVDLIKAMTKMGYYEPDHPQSREARGGLYAQFRGLLKERFELGFVRMAHAEHPVVFVEGVLLEPINLATLLGKGVGALFVPKFHEYFERHALQSFAIKAGITEVEFDTLVEVITREPGVGIGGGMANLGEILIEREVYNVSTLFSEELVGRERRMNWRTRLALSRLKKDLRIVPFYWHAGPEAVRRARLQIIEDVVRSVRRPDLLCPLLVNCDLAAVDPSLLDGVPLEQWVIETLPPLLVPILLAATTKEVAALAQAAGSLDRVTGGPRLRHLLVNLGDRAQGIGGDAGFEALAELFRAKLLSQIDLSPSLREFLQVQRFAQGVATDPTAGLRQLRALLAQPAGPGMALVGPLAADMLRRRLYQIACDILRLAGEFPEAAAKARESLGRETVIRPLLQKFADGPKEIREQVAEVFVLLGPPAVGPLIEFLSHPDRAVRRAACATLASMSGVALGPLLDRLERRNQPWYVVRNILMVLGEIGQEVPLDFRSYIRHEHHRVREEAATALARLPVEQAEPLLLNALRDAHPAVRSRAVAGLATRRTKNIGALHFMVEAIRLKGPRETEEDEVVQLQVCAALQQLGNFRYGGDGRIETVLAQALAGPEARKGLLGRLGAGGGRPKSPAVRAAIIETLGAIGTMASAEALEKAAAAGPGAGGARAREAAQKIRSRPANA